MSIRYERHMKHEFPATGGFVKNDRFSTKSALIKEFLLNSIENGSKVKNKRCNLWDKNLNEGL